MKYPLGVPLGDGMHRTAANTRAPFTVAHKLRQFIHALSVYPLAFKELGALPLSKHLRFDGDSM
jgi:hypothetical protein